ncbi:kinesin-like protein KIF15-A [Salmo trutta]|uniref:kinesin-like protein KIF15-A n=1 Tax=Salmo trutta TaxID=8032 RepID=UPI001130FE2F|nr:kinesin-like protein KIF15-A [Salmo trutta]
MEKSTYKCAGVQSQNNKKCHCPSTFGAHCILLSDSKSGSCSMQHDQVTNSGDTDSIKVFVRVRPLIHGTSLTTDGYQGLCHLSEHHLPAHQAGARTFTYNHVADIDVTQDSVFSCVAKNIVVSCMNGYNGTVFA